MAGLNENPAILEYAAKKLKEQYEAQPWYREKANTVTTIVGGVITVLAALGAEYSQYDWAVVLTTLVGFLGTIFGVSKTKNGITKTDIERAEYAAARAGDEF